MKSKHSFLTVISASLAVSCLTMAASFLSAYAAGSPEETALQAAIDRSESLRCAGEPNAESAAIQNVINMAGPVITSHPTVGTWYIRRGEAYLRLQRPNAIAAMRDASKAIELMPQSGWAYCLRGKALASQRRFDDAMKDWTFGLNKLKSADCALQLGQRNYDLREYPTALSFFEKAIALDPKTSMNLYMKGVCCKQMRDDTKAIEAFTSAIAVSAKFPSPRSRCDLPMDYEWRGELYMARQKFDAAIADFSKALEFRPVVLEAYSHRAKCYLNLHKTKEALADVTAEIKIKRSTAALVERARIYQSLGQYDLTIEDVNAALKMGANDYHPYLLRAECYLAKKNCAAALVSIEQAIRRDTFSSRSLATKGDILEAMGNKAEALKVRKEAKDLDREMGALDFGKKTK